MKDICTKSYLFIAGLVMLLVGTYIAITTLDYMTAIAPDNRGVSINLLSDLRGMGGMLLVLGAYVLTSAFRPAWRQPALIVATAVYASFVVFRSLGVVLDGLPETSILTAYCIETVLAVLGFWHIQRKTWQA